MQMTDDCVHFGERSRSEPSLAQLIELADLFEVSADYLLGRIDE